MGRGGIAIIRGAAKVNKVTLVEPDSMHDARLKQIFYMHNDFTCIRIVPMHGFMKKSDYSCTVTMHVHKIKKDKDLTFSLILSTCKIWYAASPDDLKSHR